MIHYLLKIIFYSSFFVTDSFMPRGNPQTNEIIFNFVYNGLEMFDLHGRARARALAGVSQRVQYNSEKLTIFKS